MQQIHQDHHTAMPQMKKEKNQGNALRCQSLQFEVSSSREAFVAAVRLYPGVLLGRQLQSGYYIEPSYRFNKNVGVFARFEQTDERADSNYGAARDSKTSRSLVGLNYWLTDNAVLKVDYQYENDETDRHLDGFNLGVGWQF